MYDVIVIGAGPAGCSSAKRLAGKGYKVLLVERKKLPREKPCSGILIRKSMELVKKYFGTYPPEIVFSSPHENRGMVFTTYEGKEYRFEDRGLNIRRDLLDHWLTVKAGESGTVIKSSTIALSCYEQQEYVEVVLKKGTLYTEKARYVIICDGAAGTLKRKLFPSTADTIFTYQTFYRGRISLDPHYFYAYLQPGFSEYDAWFNVKDYHLIFGVAVKDPRTAKMYHEKFLEYMKKQYAAAIEKITKTESWVMPRIRPGCPVDYGKGRILLAGETAGFLNPMGEGISCALESGYEAANAIISDLHNPGTVLLSSLYKEKTTSIQEYMLRQWRFVGHMSPFFEMMK